MLTTTEILTILFIHWIADFVCQTDKMAQGKSKEMKWLTLHTEVYSLIFLIPIFSLYAYYTEATNAFYLMLCIVKAFSFCIVTLVAHTITDYFTSRLNSRLWNEKKVHWFFVSIGFDQWLHYVQLFLTYQILK